VSRLGSGDRNGNGVQVAHLAHQNHVGIFTQGGAQAVGKAHGVAAHLALVDHAFLVLVQILNGVLQGDNVQLRSTLIMSIMEARVVDLPEPVGPVTRIGRAVSVQDR
jgi:hypothetical protein